MSTAESTHSVGRRLILMRHAKSDYPMGVVDRDRPLAARGVRDAKVASTWLRDHAAQFSVGTVTAIVSTATRAQQTWDLAGRYLDDVWRVDEPAVYEANVSGIVDLVAREGSETTYVVGHNPTMHSTLLTLLRDGDPQQRALVANRFRTCAIAVLELDDEYPWGNTSATLIAAAVPRA